MVKLFKGGVSIIATFWPTMDILLLFYFGNIWLKLSKTSFLYALIFCPSTYIVTLEIHYLKKSFR